MTQKDHSFCTIKTPSQSCLISSGFREEDFIIFSHKNPILNFVLWWWPSWNFVPDKNKYLLRYLSNNYSCTIWVESSLQLLINALFILLCYNLFLWLRLSWPSDWHYKHWFCTGPSKVHTRHVWYYMVSVMLVVSD